MTQAAGVVIVSYRTPGHTMAAVQSALEAEADVVTLIDNASGDDTVRQLRGVGDTRLTIVERDSNAGFGTAANAGANTLSTDALVFLNSDAELSRTALMEVLAELRRWNGRALVGPRLIGPDGSIQRSAGLLPAPIDLAVRALGLHGVGGWMRGLPVVGRLVGRSALATDYDSARTATGPVDTSMLSAACFAIGREAFDELGGFDERFFMYFEDADLCRRATRAGMPIRYLPQASVFHVVGASSPGDYRFSPIYARSMRQYLEKWWGRPGGLLALLLLALRLAGHAVTLRPGTRRAFDALRAAAR